MKTLAEAMQMMGGIYLLIQVLIIVLILILFIHKMIHYYGKQNLANTSFINSHHAILFLGVFGFVWGIFIQLVGLVQALNIIIEAADISPALVIRGLRNSFINPVIGLATVLLSALFWAILHASYTRGLKANT